jgi:hypothetical protein
VEAAGVMLDNFDVSNAEGTLTKKSTTSTGGNKVNKLTVNKDKKSNR